MRRFKNTRLAKMSSGHYCVIRDLGLVKGGKGLRHHEVVLDLSLHRVWRGVFRFATSALRAQATWKDTGWREADWHGSAAQEDASEPVLAAQASRRTRR
jgi:hypothetical protein